MKTEIRLAQNNVADGRDGATRKLVAPKLSYHDIQLEKTRLHYVKCGEGPPLIIVPATVSRIENWLPLIQMMGIHFTAYFFELPGHGSSTAFDSNFSSDLVAETVESLADELGHERFSLMGFSFGGVLAMKSLMRLEDRVDQIILIAPALTKNALSFSALHHFFLNGLFQGLKKESFSNLISAIISSKQLSPLLAKFISSFGKVDSTIPMTEVFQKITPATLETLAYQFDEILNLKLPAISSRFTMPCYFAMSVNDTMLDFEETYQEARYYFEDITLQKFDFPYHQPPRLPNFEEMVNQFGHLLHRQKELNLRLGRADRITVPEVSPAVFSKLIPVRVA